MSDRADFTGDIMFQVLQQKEYFKWTSFHVTKHVVKKEKRNAAL